MADIITPLPAKKPSGVLIYTWDDLADAKKAGFSQRVVEVDFFRCCHCQRNCKVTKGSKKRRHFCIACNAPTCGWKICHPLYYDHTKKVR